MTAASPSPSSQANGSGIASIADFEAGQVLHPKHAEYLAKRGIQSETALHMRVHTKQDSQGNWLVFPYRLDGKTVNRKYRLTSEKQHRMDQGGTLCLWNAECLRSPLVASGASVIITEGEFDALIAMECGFPLVTSVPNGAPAEKIEDPVNSNRYRFLWQTEKELEAVKHFILATDGDGPGRVLAHDLAAILGAERCSFVEYPEGCKDLNEVYLAQGYDGVAQVVADAKPFPVQGLYNFFDFPDMPKIDGMETGIDALHGKMQIVLGTLTVFTGYSNMGKALALDTPIPTPCGWSTMGDLRVGDELFAADGSVCRVVAATDIQHDRPCYAVKFRDGETIIADENHLWLTDTIASRMSAAHRRRRGEGPLKAKGYDQQHKRTFPAVRSTKEIAESLTVNGRRNHSIDTAKPLDLPVAQLPLDPYLLGSWLGDGATFAGVMTSADEAIPAAFANAGFPVTSRGHRHNIRMLVVKLREAGVFGNKHVPTIYKRASADQRLAMLQGLMDTDGHCDKLGNCEFVSTNEVLARDAFEIIASLGIKASFTTERAKLNGKDCGAKHRVRFCTELPVFRLDRKLARLPKKTTSRGNRFIVSCDPVESVPVRCIQIDHPSKLFLAGRSMVPTHNSTVLNTMIAHCAANDVPVCIASFETLSRPILMDGIAKALIGCPPNEFYQHPQRREAYEHVNKMVKVISNSMDEELEFTIDSFLDTARIAVVRDGCKVVILDPWNELEHTRAKDQTVTEYIGRALRRIKAFVRQYNISFWIVAHPTKPIKGSNDIPSLYDISDSAHWANKADYGLVYHRPDREVNEATLAVVKVRMGLPGEVSSEDVKYDYRTSRIARLMA